MIDCSRIGVKFFPLRVYLPSYDALERDGSTPRCRY